MTKAKIIALLGILYFSIILLAGSCNIECETSHNNNYMQENKKEHLRHIEPPKESIFFFERQVLTINDFPAEGYILDIGGGGEGVIGQLKGQQVIAIDIFREELEEAPDGPLKIIMDARDLKFLDNTFTTATSFFTLMYIKGSDHRKVFNEIFRVLVPGGRFIIWDTIFLQQPDKEKDYGFVSLRIKLPKKEILVGYGVPWPEKISDLAYYTELAERAGFNMVTKKEKNHIFFLELQKP